MKYKILYFISILFLLSSSTLSLSIMGSSDLNMNSINENEVGTDVEIDLNMEMEKEYEILPNTSYSFNLKNTSLAYFFDSPIEDIIHYPTLEVCSKFCGVRNPEFKFIYVNYYHNLTQKTTIKLTTKVDSSLIMSIKVNSPKVSVIEPLYLKTIFLIQPTEQNYLYADSYDNMAKFYFGEYHEGILITDILEMKYEYFPESHNKIFELNPGKIYVIIGSSSGSYMKLYLHNAIPEKLNLKDGDKSMLYLNKGKEYELSFDSNTMPFLVRFNPVSGDSQLDIVNDSGNKVTLSKSNKYFSPSDISQAYKGKLKIDNISDDVLIELLFSFGKEDTEIINDKEITDKEISKKVTLIEYTSKNEDKDKNMEIFIKSNEKFQLAVYAGPTKDYYFYYSASNLPQAAGSVGNYFIKLYNPLRNTGDLEENEKYYVSLIFEKKENQKITVSYYYNENPIYDLYEDLDKNYIDNVISNLTSIISSYAYLEIAQNPPQPEGLPNYNHEPIDLIGSLNNMARENRKFYDFYREMRKILGTVRDLHFRIFGSATPSGIKIDKITACLPFEFYVAKDSSGEVKMYIKYYDSCAPYFTEKERQFVKEKCDNKIALKSINGLDPFEYIHQWGREYRGNKSPHAHFTLMKTLIHSFTIRLYPYTPEELKMKFVFESDEELDLDYYIYIPNIQNMRKLFNSNFDESDQKEFDEFFENELKKNSQNVIEPNIFEIIDKFKKYKGILKEEKVKSTVIDWTYKTPEENGIKCRVDHENKVNVFVQGSFSIDDKIGQEVMYNCTRDFYKNDYRIIGIQNRDGGGWAHLCLIFHQLVQIKTQDRAFKAAKTTSFFKQHVLDDFRGYVDVNTCKPFDTIEDLFVEIVDDFSTPDKELLHRRSQVFNYINKDDRKRLRDYRKEFESYGHLKKPTDIIIYTDSFSYSATSSFIKGFQYTGGAIVVGFNGNPKIGIEQFDGSQSPASVTSFEFSDEYKNLDKLGIVVSGITFAETYDDYYIKENPYPREYLLDPVDERVDIYEPYTDETYQLFIDKAQEIFKKYNDDNKCNKNNKKLLMDPNNGIDCYRFDDDQFAHGGYLCSDDGTWTTTCQKYYCDIGYYYNQYKGKCERDICANDEGEEDIYLNGEYNEVIILNSENNKELIFHINNTEYIYFFESENGNGYIHYDYNMSCPNMCAVQFGNENHKNIIHLNYYRNASNVNIVITITSIKYFTGSIFSYKLLKEKDNTIEPIKALKTILIYESFYDYIHYLKSFDDSISIKYAEYTKEMTKSDILDVNDNYFKDCNNDITEMKPNTLYIFAILAKEYNKPVEHLLQAKNLNETVKISSDKINYLYLSNELESYLLDFSDNTVMRYIQLSRLTLDSEVIIKELETGEEVKLSKDNMYYTFNEIETVFKGKIEVRVSKGENALIEFVFMYQNNSNVELLDSREYLSFNITKRMALIKFDKNAKDRNIFLSIFSKNEKEFRFSMVKGFTKKNYYHYSVDNKPTNLKQKYKSYDINIFNADIPLDYEEYFYLMLVFEYNDILDDSYQISLTKLEKYSIDDINVDISEEKCKLVVESVKKLMDQGYVYTDIIRNPPNPEYFGKVELLSDLDKVQTSNRKYYDFFRDIRRIIGKMKDGHLNIVASTSPNGYDLKKMSMCLPFSFVIKGDKPEEAKIYIEKFDECFNYYSLEAQKFIENHLNTPLKSVNKTDPFDFIQNTQMEFNSIHNLHAQFSRSINNAHKMSINRNPLSKDQFSNIEFVFEDDKLIVLDYYLYYLNSTQLKDDKDFIDFYNNEISKEKNTLDEISIFDIQNKFYNKKLNNNNNDKNAEIEWNYTTTNKDGIQCRVDHTNKVNVFKQKTFNFVEKEYDEALEVINNCTELFYSNSYPIVGIESNNGGGIIEVSLYFQQFLQVKIKQKTFFSTKVSDLMKEEMEKDLNDIISIDTCNKYSSFDDMKEITDDYGEGIVHHRTKLFELFNTSVLKEQKKRRQDYFEKYQLKKPTEIIIFTDSFSYSSTSFFIKGLQETGAAIVVGYKGNPKSDAIFDASQSPSAVSNFNGTDVYNNLNNSGFEIIGTTFFESFNYSCFDKNPVPREYLIHPVDERVSIYQNYDDSLYDKFISKAKEIFVKYNDNQYCNPNNLKLLYDPNNKNECYIFENDPYAHGGYECDVNTTKWSKNCKPYYCDIGYYFDTYQNICVKDKCTEEEDEKKDNDDTFLLVLLIVVVSLVGLIIIGIIIYTIYSFCCSKDKDTKVGPLLNSETQVSMKQMEDKED